MRGDCCEERHSRDGDRAPPLPKPFPPRPVLLSSTDIATNSAVNLFHFELFHHFQTSTAMTLLYPSEVWDQAFQLCHEFEFLLNAMLCVAARHLAFLRPKDSKYSMAALGHSCRALSDFRSALSNDLVTVHPDAFIATSLLLQFEVWANADSFSLDGNELTSLDPSTDQLFGICSSLKQIFLKSFPPDAIQRSVFMQHIQRASKPAFFPVSLASQTMSVNLRQLFSYNRPITVDLLSLNSSTTNDEERTALGQSHPQTATSLEDNYTPTLRAYDYVLNQLCVILSFLPECRQMVPFQNAPSLLPRLARHIFVFPVICRGAFAAMITKRDPHALLLVYHLYRAVRLLLPSTEYWWASKRAAASEVILKDWLTRASKTQTPTISHELQ